MNFVDDNTSSCISGLGINIYFLYILSSFPVGKLSLKNVDNGPSERNIFFLK
jgi:hypothetical protein